MDSRPEVIVKTSTKALWVALIALCTGVAAAQGGPGPQASGPGASAPRTGPGGGLGPGGGMMRGGSRWGADYTPGWAMMTPQERDQHREQMRSAKTYEECTALRDKHHELMAARAKERGINMPAQPRRDACQGYKR
jgi:hypothetical protein